MQNFKNHNKSRLFHLICFLFCLAACTRPSDPSISLGDGKYSILGGDLTPPESARYQSVVYIKVEGTLSGCTGIVLSKRHILTAAHCVANFEEKILTVNFEDTDLKFVSGVSKKLVHPRFAEAMNDVMALIQNTHDENKDLPKNERSLLVSRAFDKYPNWGDIAILETQTELPEKLKPVAFLDHSKLDSGLNVLVLGFGITKPPSEVQDSDFVLPPALRETEIVVENPNFNETEVSLLQNQGKSICHGDSGGPGLIVDQGKIYLWGVASRSLEDPLQTCKQKVVFTKVDAYKKWIMDSIN